MIEVAVADKAYKAGDFLKPADLGWIRITDTADAKDFVQRAQFGPLEKGIYTLSGSLMAGQILEAATLISAEHPEFMTRSLRSGHNALAIDRSSATYPLTIGELVDVFLQPRHLKSGVIQIASHVRVLGTAEDRFLEIPQSHVALFLTAKGKGDLTVVRTNSGQQSTQLNPAKILKDLTGNEGQRPAKQAAPELKLKIHRRNQVTTIPLSGTSSSATSVIRRTLKKGTGV